MSSSLASHFRTFWRNPASRPRSHDGLEKPKAWHPPALHSWNLILAALICWSFIAILQVLLVRSERDGGLIFAEDVNNLPADKTFLYLYFPTILSVAFSIYWSWIDIDAKRSQPYYEMSKNEGSLGKNSLLLHYPTFFIPVVPFLAAKKRHWLTFWSAGAMVLIQLGLVPAQAGIFSKRVSEKTLSQPFSISDVAVAGTNLQDSIDYYRNSLSAIVLNGEDLPPYMTKDYALLPFAPKIAVSSSNRTWVSRTALYSTDLLCNNATETFLDDFASQNCGEQLYPFPGPFFRDGIQFTSSIGVADEYWSSCKKYAFLAAFTQMSGKFMDEIEAQTLISCEISYYEQDVEATVDSSTKHPTQVSIRGPKVDLSSSMPHLTQYMQSTLNATLVNYVKGFLPVDIPVFWPQSSERMTNGSFSTETSSLSAMAAVLGERPLVDYLRPDYFEESLLAASRLNFARAMAEYLNTTSTSTTPTGGNVVTISEAIAMEPVFVYIVEGFLGYISLSALCIVVLIAKKKQGLFNGRLFSDPSSIGATMSLAANDEALLSKIGDLNNRDTAQVEANLQVARFGVVSTESNRGLVLLEPGINTATTKIKDGHKTRDAEPTRPIEFHLGVLIPFLILFVATFTALIILYRLSQSNGLPLPSKDPFVQNIVRSYIPISIAMVIEPLWIMFTRILCLLVPFTDLLTMKASAQRSLNLDYNSYPPHLAIPNAWRNRHFLLFTLCAMILLANVLATAFTGLLFQDTRDLETPFQFNLTTDGQFINTTQSESPFIAHDHYVAVDSMYRHGTRLPPWTDGQRMFLPFNSSQITSESPDNRFRARTLAWSAEISCEDAGDRISYYLTLARLSKPSPRFAAYWKVDMRDEDDSSLSCYGFAGLGSISPGADELQQCNSSTPHPWSFEYTIPLNSKPVGSEPTSPCNAAIVLGWLHLPSDSPGPCEPTELYTSLTGKEYKAPSNDTGTTLEPFKFMLCKAKPVVQEAIVTVDSEGYVDETSVEIPQDTILSTMQSESHASFLREGLMESFNSYFDYGEQQYHVDSNASDILNYFIHLETKDNRFVNPSNPFPEVSDVVPPLQKVYSKLFSVWLALNKDVLLVPTSDTTASTQGHMIYKEERLLVNKTLFMISETILGIYIVVAIILFAQRPPKFLPRQPTTIAAMISYFAASTAVRDLKGTAHMTMKERTAYLKEKGFLYGFGSFIGPDGKVHVGIERVPFVMQKEWKAERRNPEWWRRWIRKDYKKVKTEEELHIISST